jgi:hypothetical protein
MVQFESSALVLAGFFRMLDSNPSYPYISLVIVEPRKALMKVADTARWSISYRPASLLVHTVHNLIATIEHHMRARFSS